MKRKSDNKISIFDDCLNGTKINPFLAFERYFECFPRDYEGRIWVYTNPNWNPEDKTTWYSEFCTFKSENESSFTAHCTNFVYLLKKPIGHNPLGQMLVDTCKRCKWKEEEYFDLGNHSGRKGSIMTMHLNGADDRSITKISRHSSLESLKSYDNILHTKVLVLQTVFSMTI